MFCIFPYPSAISKLPFILHVVQVDNVVARGRLVTLPSHDVRAALTLAGLRVTVVVIGTTSITLAGQTAIRLLTQTVVARLWVSNTGAMTQTAQEWRDQAS